MFAQPLLFVSGGPELFDILDHNLRRGASFYV